MKQTKNTHIRRDASQKHLYQKCNKILSVHGFTLVELIVVITILVILGTIGFISLQGFAGSARDSVRISNLTNLKQGLDLSQIKTGTYPMPESSIAITASGITIGYQGFAKDQVSTIANLSKGATTDPSDATIFTTYLVNLKQNKMQAMVFLEDNSTLTTFIPSFVSVVNASATSDYSKRYPKTLGDGLGILLDSSTGATKNQPTQELLSATFTGVDISKTQSGYTAYFGNSSTDQITGSGYQLQSLQISYANGAGFNSPSNCPTGFIAVPGNKEFSQPGFCVAKYEMSYSDADTPTSNLGGTDWNTVAYVPGKVPVSLTGKYPIADITQSGAIASCQSMGVGYHLITNNEWMTVARNIEAQNSNWSSGITGSGYISNGVSNDVTLGCGATNTQTQYTSLTRAWATKTGEGFGNTSCDTKRQLRLSSGQAIWDISGNVWEHVNKVNTMDGSLFNDANSWVSNACNGVNNWAAFSTGATADGVATCAFTNGYSYANQGPKTLNLNANNGIGRIYAYNTVNNVFLRGGSADHGADDGVFTLTLTWSSAYANPYVGFRCARW